MRKTLTIATLASFSLLTSVELKAQAVSLTTLGSAYTQDFNALANTGTTNNLTITGWFLTETGGGTRDNEQYANDTGGSNTGDTYSYGAAGNTERAIGQLRSGTLIATIGAAFTNNTGATISSLDIAYIGEQWRFGGPHTAGTPTAEQMNFEYSLNATSLTTGTWTPVTALNFNPPVVSGTAGALDGNNAANRTAISSTISSLSIANGATFWIRWQDVDASGADDGIAVDDFSITPQGSLPSLSINDVSMSEGNSGTTTFTYTVSLSAASASNVTFDIATADGTATDAADDYDAQSLTSQTITAGNTTYTFDVTVNGDMDCETNETFFVNVTNVTGATVTDGQGQGTITNDEALVADDPADVTACDSYELPPLTVGDYFTGAGGTGTSLSAGNMITSGQTVYVYATDGACTDENDFAITINTTPVADDPADVSNCGPYTLPALTVGNYFDGPGGTGTAYSAGNVISSDMTMYVYAETGTTPNCTAENSFDITIKTIPTITNTVSASRCGTGAITLEATPSAGTIDWFMAATGGTSGYTGSTINLSLSSSKTYYVEASDNGCVSAARTAVTATIDFCSQIQASQCGATVAASNTPIIADAAVGATHYRFEITNGSGGVQTITKTTRTLYLANFTYYYDSTYAIRVAVSNDGTSFSAYGSSCNITAPSIPATQVQASQCGSTLATPTTAIIADAVSGATHYRFEIDGGAQYVTKTTRTLYQANFTYAYNTTYAIRVAASTDGTNFGAYGASCNITTSAAPTTQIQASQCGTTLPTVSTAMIADAVTGATHYRFDIDLGTQTVTKTTRTLYLGNFTYTLGATYAIRVSYSTDGTNFFPYGSLCSMTAPSSALKQDESIDEATGDLMTDISVEAFPNPNSGDFTVSASHEGTFNIINEVGQLIQTVNITKENNFETRVENLQQGVYFVTGTINNEVITKKIMVLK